MQVFTDPGAPSGGDGHTVREVRIELAARGDHTTGSIVYVGERADGTLLVSVARGEARFERTGRKVAVLVVEPTTVAVPAGDAATEAAARVMAAGTEEYEA